MIERVDRTRRRGQAVVDMGAARFVAAMLIVVRAATAFVKLPVVPARLAAAYLIGTISMVWFVNRVTSFAI